MTTIVATPKAIYAESHCAFYSPFKTTKLVHVRAEVDDSEYLIGGAGDLSELKFICNMVAEYGIDRLWKLNLMEHWPPKIVKKMDTDAIIVTKDKGLFILDSNFIPLPVNEEVFAIGSGGDWARAAIDHGKTIEQAIEYACEKDPWSKPPIHKLEFPRAVRRRRPVEADVQ